MEHKRKTLKEFIYDDSVDMSFRLFIISIHSIAIVLGLTSIELIFTRKMRIVAIVTILFMITLVLIAVVTVKINKVKVGQILITALMCFVYFPVAFYNSGGISGAGPLWFVYNMFLISLFLEGGVRALYYFLEGLVAVACYTLSFIFSDYIPKYDSFAALLYSFTSLILIGASIATVLTFQKKMNTYENEKTRKQSKEIEELSEAQNRFFSSMSHEIRTPINTIIGLNEMILREDISDEIAEDAVNIRAAGKMLLNTINDILDMSKFQAGDMRILVETYDTGSMLSDIVGMLWIRAKEKNLDFHINVAPDLPAELRGDEVRIKQILMNILNNAIKYTKEGSVSLSIECEKKEDNVYNMIYSVEDTGMGIKKEDIPYLFTAFKRVDESNTKHIEGTGLGLSIVKQFLDLMGGKVTVNSVYTQGSTFIIEIPQKAASDKMLGEYNYEEKHGLGHKTAYKQKYEAPEVKLLVVDDNESNLLVVTKLLRDTKIQIDTAKSGREALEKTLEKKYHLIFMDHLMPEMDGIECFDAIRDQTGGLNKETNIVILTANAGEENRALYAKTGFNGYLVKPVTGEDLEMEVYRQVPKALINVIDSGNIAEASTSSWISSSHRKKRILITSESTVDIPQELLDKYGIITFNHKLKTKEGIFIENVEIDTNGVLAYMQHKDNIITQVPPTVDDYERFFANQLANANNIIHVAVSSKLKGVSYEIVEKAANSFDNVKIVDSRQFSSGQGLVAIMASRMAEAGMATDEIVERLGRLSKTIRASIILDNLDYLARAGEAKESTSVLMKALMLRPFSYMKNGNLITGGALFGSKERAWKKYIDSSLSGFKTNNTVVFVYYVGLTKDELEWIKTEIGKKQQFENVYFQQSSPIFAINCGPGTFGIAVVEEV